MFVHNKTNKFNYSVNEKLKYYKNIVSSNNFSKHNKDYVFKRINELTLLKNRTFDEPELIVVDDKHFGNGISKPRLAVVFDKDDKGRVLCASVSKRTTKAIILDSDFERQIDERKRWVDRSDIYEIKTIDGVKPLTLNDKLRIKYILGKK